MHARPDELLSLRDGEPVEARVAAHVAACTECNASLASAVALRERLRGLPVVPADAGTAWASVQDRLGRRDRRRRWRATSAPVAAAASVAALGLFATLRVLEPSASADRHLQEPAAVADLRARSQALEAVLAALPERPAVVRADTSLPIDSLESQVQWLDHQLSFAGSQLPAPQAEALWRNRVEVMNSLVQLRYVEAQWSVL
jgi:anti-sigma factor RsiW